MRLRALRAGAQVFRFSGFLGGRGLGPFRACCVPTASLERMVGISNVMRSLRSALLWVLVGLPLGAIGVDAQDVVINVSDFEIGKLYAISEDSFEAGAPDGRTNRSMMLNRGR